MEWFGVKSHKSRIVPGFNDNTGLGRASAPRGAGDRVAVVIIVEVEVENGALVC